MASAAVMLSIHPGFSGIHRVHQFKKELKDRGYSVHLNNPYATSTAEFKRKESRAATTSKVCVAFINNDWCKSQECEYGFTVAWAESLKGRSSVVPVVLEELNIKNNPTLGEFFRTNEVDNTKTTTDDAFWAKLLSNILGEINGTNPKKPASPRRRSSITDKPASLPIAPAPPVVVAGGGVVPPLALPRVDEEDKRDPTIDSFSPRRSIAQPDPNQRSEGFAKVEAACRDIGQLQSIMKDCEHTVLVETIFWAVFDRFREKGANPGLASELSKSINKLISIAQNPHDSTHSVQDFLRGDEATQFWEKHFGKVYSVSKHHFQLVIEERYKYILYDNAVLRDLLLRLDPYNTGQVTCVRFADFVGSDTLTGALLKYKVKYVPEERSSILQYPLLLWVDNKARNNKMLQYALRYMAVELFNSTEEFKQWINRNPAIFEDNAVQRVRIITNNVRKEGNSELNAGEEVIRFVRGQRSEIPVLVYCGNVNYAQYVKKYTHSDVTTSPDVCQQFMAELVRTNKIANMNDLLPKLSPSQFQKLVQLTRERLYHSRLLAAHTDTPVSEEKDDPVANLFTILNNTNQRSYMDESSETFSESTSGPSQSSSATNDALEQEFSSNSELQESTNRLTSVGQKFDPMLKQLTPTQWATMVQLTRERIYRNRLLAARPTTTMREEDPVTTLESKVKQIKERANR